FYNGWIVRVTTGPAKGEERKVDSYDPTKGELRLAAGSWAHAPGANAGLQIYNPNADPVNHYEAGGFNIEQMQSWWSTKTATNPGGRTAIQQAVIFYGGRG